MLLEIHYFIEFTIKDFVKTSDISMESIVELHDPTALKSYLKFLVN